MAGYIIFYVFGTASISSADYGRWGMKKKEKRKEKKVGCGKQLPSFQDGKIGPEWGTGILASTGNMLGTERLNKVYRLMKSYKFKNQKNCFGERFHRPNGQINRRSNEGRSSNGRANEWKIK